jgi:tetratricopeptide (TPR) repeat protein
MRQPALGSFRKFLCVALSFAATPGEAWAHGDLHVQIATVTAEIGRKPDSAELHLQRGELHRVHEDWAKAMADFDRAEKLDSKLVAVALGRSRLHLVKQEYRSAVSEADRFLREHPHHPQALAVRARALAGDKQFEKAAEAWRLVIQSAPSPDVEPYYECSVALAAAGPSHTDAALRTIDDGLAKLGNVPALGLYGVELEVQRKRYDAALERLDRLEPKRGRKETWREKRGDILAGSGRKEEARMEYAKALKELEALPARNRETKASAAMATRLREKARQ